LEIALVSYDVRLDKGTVRKYLPVMIPGIIQGMGNKGGTNSTSLVLGRYDRMGHRDHAIVVREVEPSHDLTIANSLKP
jgi:hypothetical protein